jgi:hypothetical protein
MHLTRRGLLAGTAAMAALPVFPAWAQQFINVLTGGTSGVYYPLGVALSEIYGKGIEGARTKCRPPRPRSRTSICCSRARARSPFRSGTRSRKP